MTFPQTRKESVLNCLLMKGNHLFYKRGARKVSAKWESVKIFAPKPQEVGVRNYNSSLMLRNGLKDGNEKE